MRKQKQKRWDWKGVWPALGTLGAIAALLTLGWQVYVYYDQQKSKIVITPSFFRLQDNCLFSLARRDKEILADLKQPLLLQDALMETLQDAFKTQALDTHGNTIRAAEFLVIENSGKGQIEQYAIQGAANVVRGGHLPPGSRVATCIRLDYLDGRSAVESRTSIVVEAGGARQTISIADSKTQKWMASTSSCAFFGYPK